MARKIRGKWHADAWVQVPGHARVRVRRLSPVQTKKAAEAFETQCVAAVLSQFDSSSKPRKKLAEFAVTYLTTYVPANNRLSTAITAETLLRCHLLPELGHLWLDEIGAEAIEEYKAKKLAGDASADPPVKPGAPQSVKNHLTTLRKVLSVAHEWGYLAAIPRVRKPKVPTARFDFLTVAEADALVSAADDVWRPMIVLALKCGLRLGELLGLPWTDVDLGAGRLTIRQSIVEGAVGSTKSGRQREIPLSPVAAELLASLPRTGPYVLGLKDGRPRRKSESSWPLWQACRRAGLRRIGWHVLRHTFASHLVQAGVSLQVVQELLGHSTIVVTMRYAHLSPKVRTDAVQFLDRRDP